MKTHVIIFGAQIVFVGLLLIFDIIDIITSYQICYNYKFMLYIYVFIVTNRYWKYLVTNDNSVRYLYHYQWSQTSSGSIFSRPSARK